MTFVNIHQCFTLIFQPFHAQEYSKIWYCRFRIRGFNNLRLLLDHVMLRRTKIERADDLGLPPRVVEIRRFFNEEEKDLYQSLYSDSKRKFNDYVAEGCFKQLCKHFHFNHENETIGRSSRSSFEKS